MNAHMLSTRLAQIASFVPEQARLADIGSDHAYLPVYLASNGKIDYAIAGEIAQGPLQAATSQIKKYGFTHKIIPRLADGLAAIQVEDQIDTIIIAGMGGLLTKRILTEGQSEGFLSNKERLILQPNNHEQLLRHWLATNHYQIYDEKIIEDHGKIYEIIVALPKKEIDYTLKELYFGPVLMEKKSAVFQKKWQKILQTKQKVLMNLKNAQYPPEDKIGKIKKEIIWIKEVLE
ncbi:tRNA (adenine(22)-N(1))-methyltransferase TrmK [Tetragenococcus osmophilus]|uniref:SAM-dependent methyltransferase n=1 Tax=Tetragenococcus osmophilus TaxID=526944 RepID=A0AA37XJI1_9ENTE|nr:class I SAM-dependent methyltransferase [Tetragenococcus osmophilus]AYW48677.1 tRNA (adenine(22)-N(1))-methyltransferase TrmK [Tetragenococcus osmophilus]GMA71542.1 SAM-dependent methyltransferase [Tetragenococcus osmophilus]